jgi:type IV pilus assembly protein PilY1
MDPTGAVSTYNAGYVGIAYKFTDGTWRDATSPGCLCEGWGVSGSGVSGYANISTDGGAHNLAVDSFTSSATSITSKVHLATSPSLSVTQTYAAAAAAPGALFEDKVTIKNNGTTAITDVKYVRVMDWDIPPTEFSEYVTLRGTASTTQLDLSHDNGFATANPLAATYAMTSGTTGVDFTDVGPSDHGAYFRFAFGTLAAGESKDFSIFYGAAPSEAAMLGALGSVGIELYSLGESSGGAATGMPATFAFGFKGVGGAVIVDAGGGIIVPPPPAATPEPGTFILLGSGLAGLAYWRRRRNS